MPSCTARLQRDSAAAGPPGSLRADTLPDGSFRFGPVPPGEAQTGLALEVHAAAQLRLEHAGRHGLVQAYVYLDTTLFARMPIKPEKPSVMPVPPGSLRVLFRDRESGAEKTVEVQASVGETTRAVFAPDQTECDDQ